MKLLLTSNGLTTSNIRNAFIHIVGKPLSQVTVALIPTASDPIDRALIQQTIDGLKQLGDITLREFELRGVKEVEVVDLKNFSETELKLKLQKFDVIWVNGGNTFYLLYWAKKSGFLDIVPKLLQEGKVYVGVSAGSILATPNIEVAGWKNVDDPNVVKLDDLRALNLVSFYLLPHYSSFWEEFVKDKTSTLSNKLICLTNTQAVTIIDGVMSLIE